MTGSTATDLDTSRIFQRDGIPPLGNLPSLPQDNQEGGSNMSGILASPSTRAAGDAEVQHHPAVASSPPPAHRGLDHMLSPGAGARPLNLQRQLFSPASNGHMPVNEAAAGRRTRLWGGSGQSPSPIRLGSSPAFSPSQRGFGCTPANAGGYDARAGSSGNQSQVLVSSAVGTPSLTYDAVEGAVTVPRVLGLSRRATTEHAGQRFQFEIPSNVRPGQRLAVQLRGVNDVASPFLPAPAPAPASWLTADGGLGAADRGRSNDRGLALAPNADALTQSASALLHAAKERERQQEAEFAPYLEELNVEKAEKMVAQSEVARMRFEMDMLQEILRTRSEREDLHAERRQIAKEHAELREAVKRTTSPAPTTTVGSAGTSPAKLMDALAAETSTSHTATSSAAVPSTNGVPTARVASSAGPSRAPSPPTVEFRPVLDRQSTGTASQQTANSGCALSSAGPTRSLGMLNGLPSGYGVNKAGSGPTLPVAAPASGFVGKAPVAPTSTYDARRTGPWRLGNTLPAQTTLMSSGNISGAAAAWRPRLSVSGLPWAPPAVPPMGGRATSPNLPAPLGGRATSPNLPAPMGGRATSPNFPAPRMLVVKPPQEMYGQGSISAPVMIPKHTPRVAWRNSRDSEPARHRTPSPLPQPRFDYIVRPTAPMVQPKRRLVR